MPGDARNRLEQHARSARTSLAAELVAFLRDNKKWWLAPILIVTLGLGALILLGGSAAAPFIYTLF
jgi:hypothetical protein